MRVYTQKTLQDFWLRHSDAAAALDGWYRETLQARWNRPADVIARYPNASIVGSDRVVFRIKGGTYRLVVSVDYQYQQVYIRFIGTHVQYDRINAAEV